MARAATSGAGRARARARGRGRAKGAQHRRASEAGVLTRDEGAFALAAPAAPARARRRGTGEDGAGARAGAGAFAAPAAPAPARARRRGRGEDGAVARAASASAPAPALGAADEDGEAAGGLEVCPLTDRLLVNSERAVVGRDRGFFPRLLLLHTGGTLGMERSSYVLKESDDPTNEVELKRGTGGEYNEALQPGEMLADIVAEIPELRTFASYDTKVLFNRDSCRVACDEWRTIARALHRARDKYDAFVVIHGTDTLAYTATALSLMLAGFGKPIVVTGSQLPLAFPRSDARHNLIDSISCAVARRDCGRGPMLRELAVCFGGWLFRGNRIRKDHTSRYSAFGSPNYPPLAEIGVDIVWSEGLLLEEDGDNYRPHFELERRVIRVPVVPGSDPRVCYGDLVGRGVRGIVLEAFGVGSTPDTFDAGWLPWLREQRARGLSVHMTTQCRGGSLQPMLYRSGMAMTEMGITSTTQVMTPEAAVVKLMLALENPDIRMDVSLAGEPV